MKQEAGVQYVIQEVVFYLWIIETTDVSASFKREERVDKVPLKYGTVCMLR